MYIQTWYKFHKIKKIVSSLLEILICIYQNLLMLSTLPTIYQVHLSLTINHISFSNSDNNCIHFHFKAWILHQLLQIYPSVSLFPFLRTPLNLHQYIKYWRRITTRMIHIHTKHHSVPLAESLFFRLMKTVSLKKGVHVREHQREWIYQI